MLSSTLFQQLQQENWCQTFYFSLFLDIQKQMNKHLEAELLHISQAQFNIVSINSSPTNSF